MAQHITEVQDAASARRCHPLVLQLRPLLSSVDDWLQRWQLQAAEGYRVWLLQDGPPPLAQPLALAGFRLQHNLVHGRFLYVDDLVTDASLRGGGHGAALMQALQAEALRLACDKLVLDSGLGNSLAHRFYYRNGLLAQALRFSQPISENR